MATKKDQQNTTLIILSSVLIIILTITVYLLGSYYTFNREIKTLQTTTGSTEVANIEKDLEFTDLSNLDSELSDIEKELELVY